MGKIILPHDWSPRRHQIQLLDSMDSGCRRGVAVWHRRAGKDSTSINWTAKCMVNRVGTYWHMLPSAVQARKVVWNGIDREGRRIIDQAFPLEIRKKTYQNEMLIELINGSMWQLCGSDNFDALVGSNPVGVVFSEYSVGDPRAWDYIRPILVENVGWAIFIYTPRGKNHGYTLYKMARNNPDWFCQMLTVDDTGLITPEMIDEERRAGMSESMIQQEFYCSFEASLQGAYYGQEMDRAFQQGRIRGVPYDPSVEVITAWDIGIGDSTAIWFAQKVGQEVHIIDYYENSGEGLAHYANVLREKKTKYGYAYGTHWAPHDIEAREIGTGRSRIETAKAHGIDFKVVPRLGLDDGIEAARTLIPRCWFDSEKCDRGVECLKSYRKEFNERMQAWSNTPVHDWASHGADAFRYLSVVIDRAYRKRTPLNYSNAGIV